MELNIFTGKKNVPGHLLYTAHPAALRRIWLPAALLLMTLTLFAQEETTLQPGSPIQPVPTQPAPAQPGSTQNAPAQPAPTQPGSVQPGSPQTIPSLPVQPAVQPAAQPAWRPGPDALQNYRIGRDMESRNRFEEANTYYNEAIRICMEELNRNISNMDSYTVLTWSLLKQRKYTDVIHWGDRALRINANDYRIVETMGEAYFYLNDYPRALTMLQRYVASIPRGDRASTAYFFMGEIYRNQRKYRHADIAYTTAVTLEGNMFLWWFRLGTVRESAGEYQAAIEAYEKCLGLNPAHKDAVDALERTRRLNAAAQRNPM
jgi:tetratricopeptide (TPR) repeat protein